MLLKVKKQYYLIYIFMLSVLIFSSYEYIKLKFLALKVTHNYIIDILPKENFKTILTKLHNDKIISKTDQYILSILSKIFKYDRKIKAGEYLIDQNTSMVKLLEQLIQGKVVLHKFTIVEGLRFDQIINALEQNPNINKTLDNLNCNNILKTIARDPTETECEGLFLADTYLFPKDTKDITILQYAYDALQNKLNHLWGLSNNNIKNLLQSKYRALILASIIEKEAKFTEEMSKISGVYHRRLSINMLLQADPTVIYGLKVFDRPLSLKDLKQSSSYNTYVNKGLPPSPIATPSIGALIAALNPETGDSLYFVADGSGKHIFSASLDEHNKAVLSVRNSKK